MRLSPSAVSRYSTRGGISANASRATMPSFSSARSVSVSTLAVTPPMRFLSSVKRIVPSLSAMITKIVQRSPIRPSTTRLGHVVLNTSKVVSTRQSAFFEATGIQKIPF
jgi:hypothetical protein